LSGLSAGEKFLFSVVILFILSLLFQFAGAFLASLIYNFRVSEILSLGAFDNPDYVAASKLIQMIGSLGTFILPAFVFSWLFVGDFFSYYSFREPLSIRALILVALMMVAVIPLINYLAEINLRISFPIEAVDELLRSLEREAEKIMTAFTSSKSVWGLLMNLFMIGVLAAVGEELIFRGLIQRLLQDMTRNAHVAIFVTAFLFSAFHFQFFSFLPRFVLGIILGYLLSIGKSIWYPILAHFVNNAMGVIYYHFNSMGSASDKLEEIGTSSLLPMAALVSLLLFVVFCLAWLYQVRRPNRFPRSGGFGTT